MKARVALLLILLLAGLTATPVRAADALLTFTEAGACKLLSAKETVTRLNEIAAQGSVTWQGKCADGFIDGPGVLRHQGVVRENERMRRYAFYLSGTAKAGVRLGTWRRETFNMFEDSTRYWTSLATIDYVDGIAKGSPKLAQVRSNADFTSAFRQLLAETDARLAAVRDRPGQPTEARAPAGADSPTEQPAIAPDAKPVPQVGGIAAAPGSREPVPAAEAVRPGMALSQFGRTAPALRGTGMSAPPGASASAIASPPGRQPGPAAGSALAFQGSGLKPAGETGLRPAAPAQPAQQQILEQMAGCFVDEINGTVVGADAIVASAAQTLRIAGWAADPLQPRIPEQAWVRLYDRGGGPGLLLVMPRNTDRPDVARALGHPAYARAGFTLSLEPGQLAPGEYTVAIVQQFGADLAVCAITGRLSLR